MAERIAAIRERHRPKPYRDYTDCGECLEEFPCEVIAALDALAASEQRATALVEAGNVLAEYVGHQPFSLAKLTAIEAWRKALAAAAPSAGAEGA